MFSFPVTIPIRNDERIYPMDVTVAIDEVAFVKSLLDKTTKGGIQSAPCDPLIPLTEIVLVDGRSLPVLEPVTVIQQYLDAYRSLDEFFHRKAITLLNETGNNENVVPLFKAPPKCATSEESTPD